jgi:hypothetical protein
MGVLFQGVAAAGASGHRAGMVAGADGNAGRLRQRSAISVCRPSPRASIAPGSRWATALPLRSFARCCSVLCDLAAARTADARRCAFHDSSRAGGSARRHACRAGRAGWSRCGCLLPLADRLHHAGRCAAELGAVGRRCAVRRTLRAAGGQQFHAGRLASLCAVAAGTASGLRGAQQPPPVWSCWRAPSSASAMPCRVR